MQHFIVAIAALSGLVLLGGCTWQPEKRALPDIAVRAESVTHSVFFDSRSDALPTAEKDALWAALADVPPLAVDEAVIAIPAGSRRAEMRAENLARLLYAHGIPPAVIAIDTAQRLPSQQATIDIRYRAASADPCQGWSRSPYSNHGNETYSNAGCATKRNLAAMGAHPGDLEGGTGDLRPDGERSSVVIQTYRLNASESASSSGSESASSGGSSGSGESSGSSQ